jgi:predicted transcriptional regulator
MEVQFTPELEAKLTHTAAEQGRKAADVVQAVVAQYFEEEARLVEAVQRGEVALQHSEYITHNQMGQRLQRFLRR